MTKPLTVGIYSEHIKLDAFLKFAGAVETGGEAKLAVQNGEVQVNGETCRQRGRKLRPGDRVTIEGQEYLLQEGGEKP